MKKILVVIEVLVVFSLHSKKSIWVVVHVRELFTLISLDSKSQT